MVHGVYNKASAIAAATSEADTTPRCKERRGRERQFNTISNKSERVEVNAELATTGHFGDESFQAITWLW